jgi:hypothetical protein
MFFSGFLHRDEVFNLIESQKKKSGELDEEHKKEEQRQKREKSADEVSTAVKTYNILKKMQPITLEEELPPPKKRCHPGCMII